MRRPHARRAGGASVNRVRRYLLRTALGLALITDQTVSAKPAKLKLKIDAGTAPVTLSEFVRQTGLQVLFETDAIRDHSTRAVSGQLEITEALRLMLEGSGLVFEFINPRTVAVRLEPLAAAAARNGVPRGAVATRPH